MRNVVDNLKEMAGEIQNLLNDLLHRHSSIYLWNTPGGGLTVISAAGNYAYQKLDDEGRQVQTNLLEKYRRFNALITVLTQGQPKDTINKATKAHNKIINTIEQTHTWCKNTTEAFNKADQALQDQLSLLNHLYDHSNGEVTYVPDTNAIIYNTNLEKWNFSYISKFTIVFLPTVFSELDSLKINHRNEEVRKKAEKLIRMIKEYRRRGKLTTGVEVVKGKIKVQALAIEPKMEDSLPWLDSTNNDDRLLAGVIEVMRNRPRLPVVAVSRDINFQNKAEFAGIPCVEPPEI
ncbi:MAG: PIN domain-containing protein [Desulfobacteraceae bacterium]|jgi:hypothetical protein|nr:PIN domain-containing protein [Desulfobacteraceae bacterium]